MKLTTIFALFVLLLLGNGCKHTGENEMDEIFEYSQKFGNEISVSELQLQEENFLKISIPEDITNRAIDLDKNIGTIRYVQLETTDQSLVSTVNELLFLDDKIIVADKDDQQIALIFSGEGEFVAQVGSRGRGPHQYNRLSEIFIDTKRKAIVIVDPTTQEFYSYDASGEFLGTEKFYAFPLGIAMLQDDTYVMQSIKGMNAHLPDAEDYQIIIADTSKKVVRKGLSFMDPVYNEKLYHTHEAGFNVAERKLLYNPIYTNKIYEISGKDTISLKYEFDLGANDYLNSLKNYSSQQEKNEAINSGKKWMFSGTAIEAGDYLFSRIHNAGYIFHNNSTGKMIYGDHVSNVRSFKEGENVRDIPIGIQNTIASSGDYFVSVCYPYRLFAMNNEQDAEKFRDLDKLVRPDDNPILVFYSLKHDTGLLGLR